jgi:glycosyltransferase involved in cell wall biosynthesis
MVKVSVIIPVHNAERYVADALQSVLEQTLVDFEMIVIDDGSTDGTHDILDRFARRDSRMRLFTRENRGYAATLNEAAELARGEFLARMDADDICMPDRFSRQVDFLQRRPEVGVVGSRVLQVDPQGVPVCDLYTMVSHEEIDRCHMAFAGSAIAHPTVMMRTKIFREAGAYRTEFEPAEDVDLWLRLAEKTRLANLPEKLLHYRLHAKSVSHSRRHQQCLNMRRAVDVAHCRRGLSPASRPPPSGMESAFLLPRIRWARMAFEAGEIGNARRLALKAVAAHPLVPIAWRSLAAAILGPRARRVRRLFPFRMDPAFQKRRHRKGAAI